MSRYGKFAKEFLIKLCHKKLIEKIRKFKFIENAHIQFNFLQISMSSLAVNEHRNVGNPSTGRVVKQLLLLVSRIEQNTAKDGKRRQKILKINFSSSSFHDTRFLFQKKKSTENNSEMNKNNNMVDYCDHKRNSKGEHFENNFKFNRRETFVKISTP